LGKVLPFQLAGRLPERVGPPAGRRLWQPSV